jgi:hypothetical protein
MTILKNFVFRVLSLHGKEEASNGLASFGIFVTMVEASCFVALFYHLHNHNKTAAVVSPTVIQQWNRVNAITMAGQLAGWTMEVWYLVVVGLLAIPYSADQVTHFNLVLST